MTNFGTYIKEQLLSEISLADHYQKFIPPTLLSFDAYEKLAKIDPTTINNQRGKYVEWLIRLFKSKEDLESRAIQSAITNYLVKYSKTSGVRDINSFKSIKEFFTYMETLPDTSGKEKKKAEKDILRTSEDIKILGTSVEYDDDEYIVAQALTQKGDIILARYKTDQSAKWCTADPSYDGHWRQYTRRGDLLVFIEVDNWKNKYQIFIEDGVIKESRDFDDRIDNLPKRIIEHNQYFFDEVYGDIAPREPLKMELDEEGTAEYFLDENFDEQQYLNRQMDEDEYEDSDYYNNMEFQINHWDRVIRNGYDVYKNNVGGRWYEADDKMGSFVSFIKNSEEATPNIEEITSDVVEFYKTFEESFEEYASDVEDKPEMLNYKSTHEYMVALDDWREKLFNDFIANTTGADTEWSYIQYFLKEFPYKFNFKLSYTRDNSDEQLSLPFESRLKSFKNFITEVSLSSAEVQEIRDREGIKFSTDKGHPTQRANTKATYIKFYDKITSSLVTIGKDLDDLKGLDYSAGLGIGSVTLRGLGANIDSYEPFPHNAAEDITYSGLNSLPDKTYDYIINSAVLNVVEQDIRDSIVFDIWNHLAPGGVAVFGVRSKTDVLGAKSAYIINAENGEVIDRMRGSYQKGFTSSELFQYIGKLLPEAALTQITGLSQVVVLAYKDEDWNVPYENI
jgi:hypothetical protein